MPVPQPRPDPTPRPRAALHHLRRRRVVAAGMALTARPLRAQAPWPQRPVRLIVGFAAGGGVDLAARLLAQSWSAALGQPVVVENRLGANGSLAMESVVRAGDGHTLYFGNTGSIAINNELFPALPYDSLRDFVPVGLLLETPFFLAISRRLPQTTLAEFIAHARANPGRLNYGSNGVGSLHHLTFEGFRRALGLDIAHVPYRGMALAMQDLAGGRLDFVIDAYPTIRAAELAGQARILGVTARERVAARPDLPTVAEAAILPGFEVQSWMALLGPAATPPAIRATMEAALATALRDGTLPQGLERIGFPHGFRDGAATRALIEAERARYRAVIQQAGIRPDGG